MAKPITRSNAPLSADVAYRAVILLALIGIGAMLVQYVYQVLLLIFLGIVFAVFLAAIAQRVQRVTRLPHGWSVTATLLALVALAVAAGLWSAPSIENGLEQLGERLPTVWRDLRTELGSTAWGRTLFHELAQAEQDLDITAGHIRRFLGIFSTFLSGLLGMLIIALLGVYFAAEPRVYVDGLLKLVAPAHRSHGAEVADSVCSSLEWWLIGRLVSMGVVFALTWLGLVLLDMPLAFMLALIAGLLSAIPNIGPVVSLLPALLLAFGESSRAVLYVFALYMAIQALESYMITPLIQRKTVFLPPALLLGAQLLMGVLAGFIGLFAAPPLLVVGVVLVKLLYIRDHNHEPVTHIRS